MNANEIRELLDRDASQPFRVRVTSGASYDVRQPGLVMPLKSRLFLAEPNSDHWTLIPYLHISAIETLRNGGRHGRKRR